MRGARYVRLIPWTLHSGSEQYSTRNFINHSDASKYKICITPLGLSQPTESEKPVGSPTVKTNGRIAPAV
jgi:hypothetical protein